ncbi:junctional cadherin 5-associated protein isoform X1 [Hemitrygon akajei]|uniref:junctional cadherin 5-associated protein isoform X1 n=2 Tax=Hemitrygon akajei TaxID=2704970 RepID=UPI003BF98ED7
MFSVEDLLISHGYQPSKRNAGDKPPSSSSSDSLEPGGHSEVRRKPGCEGERGGGGGGGDSGSRQPRVEDDLSDGEGRPVGGGCCPQVHRLLPPSADGSRLNSGPSLPCSSRPNSGKDVTYWKRRGQDFSVLLNYTNRGGSEGSNMMKTQTIPKTEKQERGSQDQLMKNKQQVTEASRPDQQKSWIAEGQSMVEREVCEGKWRAPMDRKCQSLGTKEWKSTLGRHLSDSDGNGLRQNMLPKMVSDEVFQREGMEYVKKGKSQSLPRVIPDSNGKEFQTGLHYITASGFNRSRQENLCSNNFHVLQNSSSYCNPQTSSKWRETVRQSTPFTQLPKAKFNRPLKPPSYELYQQIRRSSEMIPSLLVPEANEGQGVYFAKDTEVGADHNNCPQVLASSNLEPPVYVPPPSYKTPPHQKVGQIGFDKVPSCDNNTYQLSQSVRTHTDQAHWCSKNEESNQTDERQAYVDHGAKQHLLQDKNMNDEVGNGVPHPRESHNTSHNGYADDQKAFVKYIPFTDPRIRHITVVQSDKQLEEMDYKQVQWNATDQITDRNKMLGSPHHHSAFSVPSGSLYSTQAGLKPITDPSAANKWLVACKPESENRTKLDHCYKPFVVSQCEPSSRIISTTNHPAHFPQSSTKSEGKLQANQCSTETVTQVKKWEPDSQCFDVQGKKQPKRRMTETIFCLVSVPLSNSEGGSNENALNSDIGNGNVEKSMSDSTGNLTEQSFLSMSSSDLELQALTGNMMSENGLKKLEPWTEVSNKRAVGYNFNQHRVLRAFGSWPGDQYKDQETQTSFSKGPRSTQSFTSAIKNVAKGNQSHRQSHSESETLLLEQGDKVSTGAPAISDQKQKLSNHPIHGQTSLHPSKNSAFSRTTPTQYQVIKPHKNQLEGASKSPFEKGRDVSPEEQAEESRTCPQTSSNNGKAPVGFGQFLLKPVNRRPWDAISELENFNKEIQEQEENNQAPQKESELSTPQSLSSDMAFPSTQMPSCDNSELLVPEKLLANRNTSKENLDCGINKHSPGYPNITLEVQKPFRVSADNNRLSSQLSNPLHKPISKTTANTKSSTVLNVFSAKNAQFTKLNNEKNVEDSSCKSQRININGVSKPIYQLSERKAGEIIENSLVSNKAAGKRNVPAPESECNGITRKMFSQFNSDEIYSETDLSSLNSCKSPKPLTDNLDDLFERKTVKGISKSESFEERAARILGIDVAVEALISPTKKAQHEDRENEAKSSSEEELDSTCSHMANSKCTSGEVLGHGVGKVLESGKQLEWKGSPVYGAWLPNGNNVLQNKFSKHVTESNKELQLGKRAIINEIFHEPFQEFYNWADKNCFFGTESKAVSLTGPERKGRNTTGIIEALQGKLAASPSRTALDRLARMKEVDSVSRIRRLSIKSADSGDELEEDKCCTERRDKEGPCAPVRKEDTHATKERIVLLDQDFESFVTSVTADAESKEARDAYDPSKVETV